MVVNWCKLELLRHLLPSCKEAFNPKLDMRSRVPFFTSRRSCWAALAGLTFPTFSSGDFETVAAISPPTSSYFFLQLVPLERPPTCLYRSRRSRYCLPSPSPLLLDTRVLGSRDTSDSAPLVARSTLLRILRL